MAKHFFQKYNSIENHYKESFINSIMYNGLGNDDVEWVAREKVHGANFSKWYDGADIKNGKRSGIIGGDENFYGSNKLDKYNDGVIDTYENLLDSGLLKVGDVLAVYGEIFGGSFFGEQEEGSKRVQSGMDYHPGTEFLVFDLEIFKEDGTSYILTDNEMVANIGYNLRICPEVARGTFKHVFETPNDFNSLVPGVFGLVVPEGKHAQCEGFVMRPSGSNPVIKNDSRCIIKSKNSTFSEKTHSNNTVPNSSADLLEEEMMLYKEFLGYLNVNRVAAVASKEGDLKWSDFGKLMGLHLQDALAEFDDGRELSLRNSIPWDKVKRELHAISGEYVREYLKTVL